jgi:hypothetical protein
MRKSLIVLALAGLFVAGPSHGTENPEVELPSVQTACSVDAQELDPLVGVIEASHGGSCPWTPSLFCDCIPSGSRQQCLNCCNNATDTCIQNCTAPLAICTYECEQNGSECLNQCYIHW